MSQVYSQKYPTFNPSFQAALSKMAHKTPVPGIMWVNSDVIHPEKLSKKDFDDWYCDEHIPDVMKKSGISWAHRYQHVREEPSPPRKLSFLTLYGMPDINYMVTEDFRNLEGQSPGPNLGTIFKNAEFDTRSYKEVQRDEKAGADPGPAPLLLVAAMSYTDDKKWDEWYRGEHIRELSKCSGYRRMMRYTNSSRSLLSGFERSFPPSPTWLAILEFEGPRPPWPELRATDATDWANKVIPGIRDIDIGVFKLVRVYEKDDISKL